MPPDEKIAYNFRAVLSNGEEIPLPSIGEIPLIEALDLMEHYEFTKIVRCKDCRYGYQFYDVQKGITDSWVECRNPNGLNRDVPEDGYCYCGERRTDE